MLELVARICLMAIPLYIANSTALLLGFGKPLDFGKKFLNGMPLLGEGKTFRGTFSGLFFGIAAALAINAAFPQAGVFFNADYAFFGALLAIGAVAGDIVAAFFKRRFGIPRGNPVFPLDQLDFVAGGIVVGSVAYVPGWAEAISLVVVTIVAHKVANLIAYRFKLKKVPW